VGKLRAPPLFLSGKKKLSHKKFFKSEMINFKTSQPDYLYNPSFKWKDVLS